MTTFSVAATPVRRALGLIRAFLRAQTQAFYKGAEYIRTTVWGREPALIHTSFSRCRTLPIQDRLGQLLPGPHPGTMAEFRYL